jgi:hypothetical protein
MKARRTRRRAPGLGALLVAIAALGLLASGAAARAHGPRCGYRARVVTGYTVRLHRHGTSGVFGVYLLAPVRFTEPYGALCIKVIHRRNLPLVRPGSSQLGSWFQIVHNHRTIFPGFGGRPVFPSNGVVITVRPGTLGVIERCPSCFSLEMWPLGYHGRRPELSAPL